MKQLLIFFSFLCLAFVGRSQSAYIQINGEPGLSVYLNNTFKGKTTKELNGYIIENVPAGKNLIKIVKEGYVPFEEYVTVKAGEVFAYKVKPFEKHAVSISQEGRSAETEKKAEIRTGKLVVQSVPIEIKISIPEIEGVINRSKTQDQWMINDLPEGTYTATFMFNDKKVTKTIQVDGDNTTSVFVNMMSGAVTIKSTLEEKKAKKQSQDQLSAFVNEFCNKYKFRKWSSMDAFLRDHPEAKFLLDHTDTEDKSKKLRLPFKHLKKQTYLPGYTYIEFDGRKIHAQYTLSVTKDLSAAKAAYGKILTELKNSSTSGYLSSTDTDSIMKEGVALYDVNNQLSILLNISLIGGEWYYTDLVFIGDRY